MTYIENIFLCLTTPMLVGAVCAGRKHGQAFMFVLAGYSSCLLSAYINSFFAGIYASGLLSATVEIAPVVEEVMKLAPLLFYLLVFEPTQRSALLATLTIGASFATFENACYLAEHGATELMHLLIRGLGSGAMHIVCGAIIGYGLIYVWKTPWLKTAGTFGLLCAAITYHAIYNLLVSASGGLQIFGFLFPVLTAFVGISIAKLGTHPKPAQAL